MSRSSTRVARPGSRLDPSRCRMRRQRQEVRQRPREESRRRDAFQVAFGVQLSNPSANHPLSFTRATSPSMSLTAAMTASGCVLSWSWTMRVLSHMRRSLTISDSGTSTTSSFMTSPFLGTVGRGGRWRRLAGGDRNKGTIQRTSAGACGMDGFFWSQSSNSTRSWTAPSDHKNKSVSTLNLIRPS